MEATLDSPKKQKKREKLAREFGANWENDYQRKQIIRKPRSWKKRAWEFIAGKKFSVFSFYWWAKYDRLENEVSRKFHFPVKHDNLPVEGLPMKYELQGGWTFKDTELKFLKDGPLVSEGHPEEVLVGYDHGQRRILRFAREWAPVATIFGVLSTFLMRVFGFI